jgi:putative ABC transport system substrate-binding protein
MRRRDFIAAGAGAVAWPFIASAQQRDSKPLVGLITTFTEADMRPLEASFRDRMRELGWIDDQNITITLRTAGGDYAKLDSDAAAMVSGRADVIVAMGSPGLAAVKRHTGMIPVVFTLVADPVGQGFLQNLARPGGNVTGLTNFEFAVGGKWLSILRELDGTLLRVTLITNPENSNTAHFVETITAVGKSTGVEVRPISVRNAAEIETAIESATKQPHGGLIVFPDGLPVVHHELIITLAERFKLPAIYPFRIFPVNGGLLSYGLDYSDIYRRAAEYVDAILKGAKPGDLPVQAPNKFELIINAKAAKALGLTIPQNLQIAADEIIE